MHLTREEIKALIQLLEWQALVNQEQGNKEFYKGTQYSIDTLNLASKQNKLAERFQSLLSTEDQISFLIVRA